MVASIVPFSCFSVLFQRRTSLKKSFMKRRYSFLSNDFLILR